MDGRHVGQSDGVEVVTEPVIEKRLVDCFGESSLDGSKGRELDQENWTSVNEKKSLEESNVGPSTELGLGCREKDSLVKSGPKEGFLGHENPK